MTSPSLAWHAAREMGIGPLALYGMHQLQLRSGWLRMRTPMYGWSERPIKSWLRTGLPGDPNGYRDVRVASNRLFFFNTGDDLQPGLQSILAEDKAKLIGEAREILDGKFRLFGGPPIDLGSPPGWGSFPRIAGVEGDVRVDLDQHWTSYPLDTFPHDVKLLWEPSRFGWAFVLGRAYRVSRDEQYAEAFWNLLASWREINSPNSGPHWYSAQEAALRLLAIVFGYFAFLPVLIEQPDRMVTLCEMVAVHADRLPPTLSYSRAQGNNHLLTESAALYTAGLLFPEFANSDRWYTLGRKWLISAARDQFFTDGGYIQQSANYHRLALHAVLWAVRLGDLNSDSFPIEMIKGLEGSINCLEAMVDPFSGRVPNFGPMDGALILPLTTCGIHDYRPIIQLARLTLQGEIHLESGPWDEAAFWFGYGGQLRSHAPNEEQGRQRSGKDFPQAGLYYLRGRQTWGMLRSARFTSRPGHSDQLHLDLWWRGENLARDAGTYLYNGEEPWTNGLAVASVHNTILIDEKEPMRRAGRFLWLNWANSEMNGRWASNHGVLELLVAESDGYRDLGIKIRRTVIRGGDKGWVVIDEALGQGHHSMRTGWLLGDYDWVAENNRIMAQTPVGHVELEISPLESRVDLLRAGELQNSVSVVTGSDVLGWYSPTYGYKDPAYFFTACLSGELPIRTVTYWRFDGLEIDDLEIEWREIGADPISLSRLTFGHEVLEF
ncbi:MAG: hypothetical protein GTO18_18110 [Anaerolineales bacterium]|nr:hypothetical protein [Anaerolineales bacterium]